VQTAVPRLSQIKRIRSTVLLHVVGWQLIKKLWSGTMKIKKEEAVPKGIVTVGNY
jgi:hypothetical protein